MDLDQDLLRKFLAVAEDLNFSRAANRLHISQPAVSQAIRKLEGDLGSPLFERDHRGVRLTTFGRAFVQVAHTLVEQHREALAAARRAAQGEGLLFRVGYSPFVDLALVSAVQTQFSQFEPKVEVQLFGSPSAEQPRLLGEGKIDVGLMVGPVDARGLRVEVLTRTPLMVGLPRKHGLARRKRLTLIEVCREPIIWLPRHFNPALHDWFFAACAAAGCSPKVAVEVTTVPEFLQFAARGHGLALLPRSATSINIRGLVFRELMDEKFRLDLSVAYQRKNESDLIRRFIALVERKIREHS